MVHTFHSAYFGPIQIAPESVIEFPVGLPGFEETRRFTMLEHPEQPALVFLQCLERTDLCFLAMPVEALRPGYQLAIGEDDLELLDAAGDAPLRAYAVLSLVEGEEPTANLLAPIVIHTASRRAVQAIRPDHLYSCREAIVCS